MADRFVSNFTNRLDAKGRVSIPSGFRAVLAKDGYEFIRQLRADRLRMHFDVGLVADLQRPRRRVDAEETVAAARVLEAVHAHGWRHGQLLAHHFLRGPARRFDVEAQVRRFADLVGQEGLDGGKVHGRQPRGRAPRLIHARE